MNTIAALEDLCFRDQGASMPAYPLASWTLPQYNVYIDVTSQQVRYAIWGLQLTASVVRKEGFWPIIARYFWQGDFAGRVDIGNKNRPYPPTDDSPLAKLSQGSVSSANTDIETNTTTNVTSSQVFVNTTAGIDLLGAARLTIVPNYNGASISPRAVFGTAINVMVLGAENGPNTYCLQLLRPEVEIRSEYDAQGQPLLKYKHAIRAMAILTEWMVMRNEFGEIDVDILRGGVLIGKARIKKRVRASESQGFGYL